MKIIGKVTKKLKSRNAVDPRLIICVECGSDQVAIKENKLLCNNCGTKRKLKKTSYKLTNFSQGEFVKIIESGKPSEQTYEIRKVKRTENGKMAYLLKSNQSDITLLFHESLGSYLKKAD